MSFDDLKEHDGEVYTGMRVGRGHRWRYPDGRWRERKVSPDEWAFDFASRKVREDPAPPGSGAPIRTRYHWYILAHQRVRKVDENTYETRMEGRKFKVAHKRPHWRRWSTGYPDGPSEDERVRWILSQMLARLEAGEPSRPTTLRRFRG